MRANFNRRHLDKVFWLIVALLSAYYLYRGIKFRFFTKGNLTTKEIWYYAHLATAIAPLLIGPFQFWTWLRLNHVSIHRTLGKIYIIGSILGGLTALYLGITIDLDGSVVPLILLSTTWLFMTVCAWITIRRGNVQANRIFVIRS